MKALKELAILFLLLAVHSGGAGGQTLTNLYWFGSQPTDGRHPSAGLVQGSDANFYGTTLEGGAGGCGTVFRISPSGSYTNLYSFTGGSDGGDPSAGLVQGSDANFYGTTLEGGAGGCGTVFRISPSGSYTNLYSFTGGSDGGDPSAGLVQGSDANFYGTTHGGGAGGCGTVFRISPSGSYTNLYSFTGGSDGGDPSAGLVQGSDANFYGMTSYGGNTNLNDGEGFGTVFRISPSGTYTNLYSFSGYPSDGVEPNDGLVRGCDGNFYGTTSGGEACGFGTVFRISPSGSYTNLYSFTGGSDGGWPWAGLVQGSDGNFYGTTLGGGAGTLFRISPSGSFSNLYSFSLSFSEGYSPKQLVQGSDGNFYGITYYGGASDYGSVFRFSVPLNPPANQISAIQISSNDIAITITSVAGETYQLQYSDDLTDGTWSNVVGASVTNSIGAMLTLTNFGGASLPQRFYRFVITP